MTGTERKVFQKYYPPDYDPSKIPRAKLERNRQFVQRVMIPYNMQCNTCGEYIYKGKKFNMRRETAEGEYYLGLRIFRFYVRCPNCLAELTFKTDLENTDYKPEHGHTRLFDAAKLHIEAKKAEAAKEEADAADPMKMLEKRTKMSRAEMEALGTLEEIREVNKKKGRMDMDSMVDMVTEAKAKALRRQEEEEEALIESLFGKRIKTEEDEGGGGGSSRPQRILIKRIEDDDEIQEIPGPSSSSLPSTSTASLEDFAAPGVRALPAVKTAKPPKAPTASLKSKMGALVRVKPKVGEVEKKEQAEEAKKEEEKPSGSGLGLLGDYGSSSSSDGESNEG